MRGRRIVAVIVALIATRFLGLGVGHALLGRWWRGLAWAALAFVSAAAVVLVSIHFVWVTAGAIVGQAIDVGFIEIRERPWERRAVAMAAFVVGGVAVAVGIRMYLVEAFKIPQSGMSPTLVIGDHVFADKTGRAPIERGDVIVFRNPCTPEKDFVKRVVAMAGDTVEVRCTVLYVNGQAQPRELVRADAEYQDYDDAVGRWETERVSRWRERIGGTVFDIFLDSPGDAAGVHDYPNVEGATPGMQLRPQICPGLPDQPTDLGENVGTPDPAKPCEQQVHYVLPPGYLFVMGDNRDNSSDSRVWGPVPVGHVKGTVIGIWWSRDRSRIGDL